MLLKNRNFIKYFTLTCLCSSAGWIYYQVKRTKRILNDAWDTSVLQATNHFTPSVENIIEEIIEIEPFVEFKKGNLMSYVLDSIKFIYARRLLAMTKNDNRYFRAKAVRQLASVNYLSDWHCALLANMIDPKGAVALARSGEVDSRYFLQPPLRYHNYDKDMLLNVMRELLVKIFEKSQHSCIGYFLTKIFFNEHDSERILDNDSTFEINKFIQSEKDILPLCLESLLHHASMEHYSKDIADLDGLPLLMEIYSRFKDDVDINIRLCQILSHMSFNRSLLEPIHRSGWIGVLYDWLRHDDIRVSIPAARALANLDVDDDAIYSQSLYILHPVSRTLRQSAVDVVFIHGLLGGVFYTWRQKNKSETYSLGLMGKITQEESLKPECGIQWDIKTVKNAVREYIQDLKVKSESENICKGYEVVYEDIPVKTNVNSADDPLTSPGESLDDDEMRETYHSYTYCWPKDWLAKDCKNIRIIGINYSTTLSTLAQICPQEKEKFTLDERSDFLLAKLVQSGLGQRPILWITHSMGGLIVKNALWKALSSDNPDLKNISMNTRGIVFYSTPHNGSKVANLTQATALILWPSVEVRELRENSPKLKEIHEKFLKIVENVPIKVVTFNETESTSVTAMKFNFLLVEPQSGNPGIGEYYEIPRDHLGICKPVNKYSFLYQKVLHLLRDIINKTKKDVKKEPSK